jgi:hypothetical protein
MHLIIVLLALLSDKNDLDKGYGNTIFMCCLDKKVILSFMDSPYMVHEQQVIKWFFLLVGSPLLHDYATRIEDVE